MRRGKKKVYFLETLLNSQYGTICVLFKHREPRPVSSGSLKRSFLCFSVFLFLCFQALAVGIPPLSYPQTKGTLYLLTPNSVRTAKDLFSLRVWNYLFYCYRNERQPLKNPVKPSFPSLFLDPETFLCAEENVYRGVMKRNEFGKYYQHMPFTRM